jgi:hypothetical protein
MSKVWSFGDSFAEGRCSDVVNKDGDNVLDKTYAHYFANERNIEEIEVYGKGGYSRLDIVGTIINKIGKIKKDDYVLILRTDSMRLNILPMDVDIVDTISKNPSMTGEYIMSINASSNLIRANKKDNLFKDSTLTIDELSLIRNFFINIFLKYKKNYTNYFNDFFDGCIASILDITNNVCVIDSTIWLGKLDYMANEYYGTDSDLYCKCGHWTEKLHKIVTILVDTAIENNELYINDKTCNKLWELSKERLGI